VAFLKLGKTLDVFFSSFDYGSTAMTMRGQAKNHGYWNVHQNFDKEVNGVYQPFKQHFEKIYLKWTNTAHD
jgi:hypothetical protein